MLNIHLGPVAQRLEQGTHNPLGGGSNPSGPIDLRCCSRRTLASFLAATRESTTYASSLRHRDRPTAVFRLKWRSVVSGSPVAQRSHPTSHSVMTVYEHAMVGVNGAVAIGLHRWAGWRLVALAGICATLPDWDGLTILLGGGYYAQGHRIWGHNLLVSALSAALLSVVLYRFDGLGAVRRWIASRWSGVPGEPQASSCEPSWRRCGVWVAVAVAASFSHLAFDTAYSTGRNLSDWGVPLGWPFTERVWIFRSAPWGDVGATVILAAAMFAMLRWPLRSQWVAAGSLALVIGYVLLRAALR